MYVAIILGDKGNLIKTDNHSIIMILLFEKYMLYKLYCNMVDYVVTFKIYQFCWQHF